MAQAFKQYSNVFMEQASNSGLRYTFQRGLSAPFAASGHLLDTFLGLDGLFSDKDAHFGGPFGFVLGILPAVLGAILGAVLHVLLRAFCWIPYYALDWPLSFIFKDFNKKMAEYPLDKISALFIALTEGTPDQMKGPFGFLFGFIPHIVIHLLHRVFGLTTNLIEYPTDHICDGFRFVQRKIGLRNEEKASIEKDPALSDQSTPNVEAWQAEQPKEEEQPKKRRVRRDPASQPPDEKTEPKLYEMVAKEIDLLEFARNELARTTLLLKAGDLTQQAFRNDEQKFINDVKNLAKRLSAIYAGGRKGTTTPEEEEKFNKTESLRTIFSNEIQAKKYMYFHFGKFNDPAELVYSAPQSQTLSPPPGGGLPLDGHGQLYAKPTGEVSGDPSPQARDGQAQASGRVIRGRKK